MNPNEANNITEDPLEYLNQISPKTPNRFAYIDKKIIVIIGLVVVLIVSLIIWFATNNNSKQSTQLQLLAERVQNMNTLLAYDTQKINDGKYSKAIAETKVIFASDNYQLSQSFNLVPNQKAVSQESIGSTITDLDKAAASNNLITEYTSALNTQINRIITSLNEVPNGTNDVIVGQTLSNLSELSRRLSSN